MKSTVKSTPRPYDARKIPKPSKIPAPRQAGFLIEKPPCFNMKASDLLKRGYDPLFWLFISIECSQSREQ